MQIPYPLQNLTSIILYRSQLEVSSETGELAYRRIELEKLFIQLAENMESYSMLQKMIYLSIIYSLMVSVIDHLSQNTVFAQYLVKTFLKCINKWRTYVTLHAGIYS